jgi:MFS family permease
VTDNPPEVLAARAGWKVTTVVMAAPVAVLSGMQLILPLLPVIQRELGLTDAEISLVSSVYLLPGVLLAIPAGLLGDRIGRRLLFGWSLVIFGLAGLLLFFRHDFPTVLGARLLQGFAFAAILPLTITMIGELWGNEGQLRTQGMRVVGMNVANVVWPMIGGLIAAAAWESMFLLQGLALPLGIAALFVLPKDAKSFRQPANRPRSSLFQMMKTRRALTVEATAFLRFLGRFGFLTYGPILLVTRLGFTPIEAGLVLGAAALCATVSAGSTGWLAGRVRPSRLLTSASLGMATGLLLLSAGGIGAWVGPLLFGTADGVFAVVHSGFMTEAVPRNLRASFVATTGAIKNLGKFLAPSLVVALLVVVRLDVAFVVLALLTASMAPLARVLRTLDGRLAPHPAPIPVE